MTFFPVKYFGISCSGKNLDIVSKLNGDLIHRFISIESSLILVRYYRVLHAHAILLLIPLPNTLQAFGCCVLCKVLVYNSNHRDKALPQGPYVSGRCSNTVGRNFNKQNA